MITKSIRLRAFYKKIKCAELDFTKRILIAMNLWDLKLNQEAIIHSVSESCSGFQRLQSYGFTSGEKAKFLYKTALQGPRVYLLGDSVYSLSQQVASQIFIQDIKDLTDE